MAVPLVYFQFFAYLLLIVKLCQPIFGPNFYIRSIIAFTHNFDNHVWNLTCFLKHLNCIGICMYLLVIVRHCTSSGLLKAAAIICVWNNYLGSLVFVLFLEAYLPSRNQVDAMNLMAVLLIVGLFFVGFIDILSGMLHGIHKTCNTFTCKLFVRQLITKLSISVVIVTFFKQTFCFIAFPLHLHLELCMALSMSFDHFLKTFFAMVSVFLVSCTNGVFFFS